MLFCCYKRKRRKYGRLYFPTKEKRNTRKTLLMRRKRRKKGKRNPVCFRIVRIPTCPIRGLKLCLHLLPWKQGTQRWCALRAKCILNNPLPERTFVGVLTRRRLLHLLRCSARQLLPGHHFCILHKRHSRSVPRFVVVFGAFVASNTEYHDDIYATATRGIASVQASVRDVPETLGNLDETFSNTVLVVDSFVFSSECCCSAYECPSLSSRHRSHRIQLGT